MRDTLMGLSWPLVLLFLVPQQAERRQAPATLPAARVTCARPRAVALAAAPPDREARRREDQHRGQQAGRDRDEARIRPPGAGAAMHTYISYIVTDSYVLGLRLKTSLQRVLAANVRALANSLAQLQARRLRAANHASSILPRSLHFATSVIKPFKRPSRLSCSGMLAYQRVRLNADDMSQRGPGSA